MPLPTFVGFLQPIKVEDWHNEMLVFVIFHTGWLNYVFFFAGRADVK